MRILFTGGLILTLAMNLTAQRSQPQKQQIGIVVSDVIMQRFTLEYTHMIAPLHGVGLRASLAGMQPNRESVYEGANRAYHLEAFHQWFFTLNRSKNKFLFLRSGLRFTDAELFYSRSDWVEETRDGNPFLVHRTRTLTDRIYKLNGNITTGVHTRHNHFYFEVYGGVQYEGILNPGDMATEPTRANFASDQPFIQEGFLPVAGVILGLGYTR